MAPETHEEQLARELLRLGVETRLKGAPRFHWWEIGESKRESHKAIDNVLVTYHKKFINGEKLNDDEEKAFTDLKAMYYNPNVNAYTIDMMNEDTQTSKGYPLYVNYGWEEGVFKLYDVKEATQQIIEHFYPINWREFEDSSDWELMREVIPSMKNTKVRIEIYENQRWLYDERSQRAAETLAYRIKNIYPDKQLPERIPVIEQQYAILEEYDDRLGRGVDARRWLQGVLNKFSKRPKRRQTIKAALEQI